jgi:hypothetical protein
MFTCYKLSAVTLPCSSCGDKKKFSNLPVSGVLPINLLKLKLNLRVISWVFGAVAKGFTGGCTEKEKRKTRHRVSAFSGRQDK